MFPPETTFVVTDRDNSDVDPSRYTAIAIHHSHIMPYSVDVLIVLKRQRETLKSFAPYVESIRIENVSYSLFGPIDLAIFSKLKHVYFNNPFSDTAEHFFERAPDSLIERLETVIILSSNGMYGEVMSTRIPRMRNLRVLHLENMADISSMVHANSLPMLHTLTYTCTNDGGLFALLAWIFLCMPALKVLNVRDKLFEKHEPSLKDILSHGEIVSETTVVDPDAPDAGDDDNSDKAKEFRYFRSLDFRKPWDILVLMRCKFQKTRIHLIGEVTPQVKTYVALLDVILDHSQHTKMQLPEALLYELIKFI